MTESADYYPTAEEVNGWCGSILYRAEEADLKARVLDAETWPFRLGVRHTGGHYVEFTSDELGTFYGFWQPCPSGRGPLLLHLPGYGSEMSAHPELVSDGYNVLHINPLGHATPQGPDESKRPEGDWPVLPETVHSLGERGYVDWLAQAAAATLWARERNTVEEGRYAFFGSSQGGGTAMLLSSIFTDAGVRAVAADVPFLTNFPMARDAADGGAYGLALDAIDEEAAERPDDLPDAWRALGFIDVMSHVHRLTMPTLLTAGAEDATCPPPTIEALFERLPGTRSYTRLAGQGHAYTMPFLHLAKAWFRVHV
ncbi:MAG: acetylxylan esterase [Candidatus Brocadiia bacterium]